MHRRFPTAILLIAGLLTAAVAAAREPARPPIASVSLSGGFAYRETAFQISGNQVQPTAIQGISPWFFRLRADWFALRWLGVEGEGSGDFFRAIKEDVRLATGSQRGAGRLALALRFMADSGFVLSGSLGYGFSVAPVVRVTTPRGAPFADGIFSHGPALRAGIGFNGERFEVLGSVTALIAVNGRIHSLEPQVWLAGRVADLGPIALWVGLDVGALGENSPTEVGYSGNNLRFALGLKLQLLPPRAPASPLGGDPELGAGATSLALQVLLPDGTPGVGALVTVDDAAPAPVDANGQLTLKSTPGAHPVTAKLSGYRATTISARVSEGKVTPLVLRLEALTGPGQLSGTIRASATGKPIPEATVTAGAEPPIQTGADGTYRFASLGPGPVQVKVEAQGFVTADEIAQVPPESAAILDFQLDALGKGSPATVRGLVRALTGEAIKATVVIKSVEAAEAKKALPNKVQVTPEGRFFLTVPGGTYLFVISAPGYVTQTRKVVLSDGDQAIVHTELQKVSR